MKLAELRIGFEEMRKKLEGKQSRYEYAVRA